MRLVLAAFVRQCRRRMLRAVRQRQPLREQTGGFVRRRSVERHHRRGESRRAAQLRAPSVADGRDLDVVRAPANRFEEAMNCHVSWFRGK